MVGDEEDDGSGFVEGERNSVVGDLLVGEARGRENLESVEGGEGHVDEMEGTEV